MAIALQWTGHWGFAIAADAVAAAAFLPTAGTLADVEREYILRVFKETDGVISATATRLGLPRTTLNALMQRLGISRKGVDYGEGGAQTPDRQDRASRVDEPEIHEYRDAGILEKCSSPRGS